MARYLSVPSVPQKDLPVKTLKKVGFGTLVAGSTCVAGLTAAGAASAAVGSATTNDRLDARDRSLSVHPHPVNREVAATVAYDGVRRDPRRYLAKRVVRATPTK
jgi:hypothetical protein